MGGGEAGNSFQSQTDWTKEELEAFKGTGVDVSAIEQGFSQFVGDPSKDLFKSMGLQQGKFYNKKNVDVSDLVDRFSLFRKDRQKLSEYMKVLKERGTGREETLLTPYTGKQQQTLLGAPVTGLTLLGG